MSRIGGLEALEACVKGHMHETILESHETSLGDSEIEKLLFAALDVRLAIGACEFNHLRRMDNAEHESKLLSLINIDDGTGHPAFALQILIRAQAKISDRRVDFLIHALDWRAHPWQWRRLIIECDGHDFHERTKQQAKRDRSRDRDALMAGYDSFRFTGSEIWNDPWGCAEQITNWAIKGWP